MNLQSIMAQAQKMQKELKIANEEIERNQYNGNSGAINIVINGKYEIIKLDIIDDELLKDKEMLQDMLLLAYNDAVKKLQTDKEKKIGKYTGGLGGLL